MAFSPKTTHHYSAWQSLLALAMMLFVTVSLQAQDSLQNEPPAIRRLVAYMVANLNTLGDPSVSSNDKDIIITASYNKLFRDASVQVEDDLDTARKVITYKPVQAYLQDIDFFFRSARFDYRVLDVERQTTDDGLPSWRVRAIRVLETIGLRGDTLREEQERFIEINETDEGLKIASVYTTKLNQRQARRSWWSGLSPTWKKRLAGEVKLTPDLLLADASAYSLAWLRTPSDTFLLPGWSTTAGAVDTAHVRIGTDTVAIDGFATLPLDATAIDIFLAGLEAQVSLDLHGQVVEDWAPLGALRGLKKLNLSETNLADAQALRALTQLEEVNLSATAVRDLAPLRFARKLRILSAAACPIDTALPVWPMLERLDLSACPLHANWAPPALTALQYLNVSGTGLTDLSQWPPLSSLMHLDISQTAVASLQPLAGWTKLQDVQASQTAVADITPLENLVALERVGLDQTPITNLDALANKPGLQRIDADGTALSDSIVRRFTRAHPNTVVVHETTLLNRWWASLNLTWKRTLLQAVDAPQDPAGIPARETLHRMVGLRSLDLREAKGMGNLTPLREIRGLQNLNLAGQILAPPPPTAGAADSIPDPADWMALAGLKELRTLDLSRTNIAQLPFVSSMTRLQKIWLDHNPVRDLSPLRANNALQMVWADSTALSDSAAAVLQQAKPSVVLIYRTHALQKWWQQLSPPWQRALQEASPGDSSRMPDRETLQRFTRVTELNLAGQGITSLHPVAELKALEHLDLTDNRLQELSALMACRNLRVLLVARNPLEDLRGLGALSVLQELVLDDTPVRDLEPLAALGQMRRLSFAGTQVKDLGPLSRYRVLEYLNMANTRVRSLGDLEEVMSLRELVAFNTALNENRVARFREAHPQCRVTFY